MCRIDNSGSRRRTYLSRLFALVLPLFWLIANLTQPAFAQNTYVITDGSRVLVHTTYATNPAEVLSEAGLALGAEDTYTTQEGDGVSEIRVRRVQTVLIDLGSEQLRVNSNGESVEELLSRLHLDVSSQEDVSVPLEAATYDGMELTVHRTVQTQEVYTKSLPYKTRYCEDASAPEGTRRVLTAGTDGEVQYVDAVVYKDGQEVNRHTLSQAVTLQPVDQVIAIGTARSEADGEEAQQPTISEGTITTQTGEVLTYSKVLKVVATGYNNTNEGCSEYTATGTLARVGAVAVDPNVIPYGTRMYIVSDDGEYIYGLATAEDCGGSIVNNRIDLYFDTNEECFQFGVRNCTVYILG